SKIDLLIQQNEKFLILSEETIDTGYTRFYAIVTSLKYLDKDDPNKNHVRKFLCALLLKLCPKVIAIKEVEDLAELPLNDLIDNFKVYEMVLEINGVISKSTKEKVKSLAFKAKVTRGQDSNDSFFKKGNRFGRENRFGNDGDRFVRGHDDRRKVLEVLDENIVVMVAVARTTSLMIVRRRR
ncbi:hypothetical protein Tco_0683573, partial [Tanacetum coccineum]